ncbi:hypothetical protein ACFVYC_09630 [Pseudarthrobacter sp. NPDC058329]|uniref:hypothetical protein n=1 Tax=Pseudarthrobacter sp. NPDC058329 TaxID=3346448 RepID=UPI0036DC16B6
MKLELLHLNSGAHEVLHEYESAMIGRMPPLAADKARIVINNAYLSRLAVTVFNRNDRMIIESNQDPASGRVHVIRAGKWCLVRKGSPVEVFPMGIFSRIRIELLDEIGSIIELHIKASGGRLHPDGEPTRAGSSESLEADDWVLAITAVECARLAGKKLTASSAKPYFLRYIGRSLSNTGAFESAYQKAGTLLLGDPYAGKQRLLDAASEIDPLLVRQMTLKLEG